MENGWTTVKYPLMALVLRLGSA